MSEKHVADVKTVQHPEFDGFVATIEALRAVDGCLWDREQTHETIAHNMIEEAYEAVDAIEADDCAHLREELGDVLLQVVLQSQMARDAQEFSIDDVCRDINDKIIRRHPHVFGDTTAQNAQDVSGIWEKVKLDEKETADEVAAHGEERGEGQDKAREEEVDRQPTSLLADVPKGSPALIQAQKISRKAVSAGFEWDSIDAVWNQVVEEIDELKDAYERAPKSSNGKVLREVDASAGADAAPNGDAPNGDAPNGDAPNGDAPAGAAAPAAEPGAAPTDAAASAASGTAVDAAHKIELEMGDVLFSLVNIARRMGIDAEESLRSACLKFRDRWTYMEDAAWEGGHRIEDLDTDKFEKLWQIAKTTEVLT